MLKILETALLAFTGLLVALAASWLLLASMNFSYPIWLDHAGINETISRYGPENKIKHGFEKTTRDERIELFAAINRSIHSGGTGLEALTFSVEGEPTQTLLTESEVIHLQDVANLISVGKKVAFVSLLLWLAIWGYLVYFKRPIPSLIKQMAVMFGLLAITTVVVVSVGSVKVFYALHVMIFPEGHQWYYFYQESLMATLMNAPYLFGWIAIEILAVTVVFCVVFQGGAARLVSKFRPHSSSTSTSIG